MFLDRYQEWPVDARGKRLSVFQGSAENLSHYLSRGLSGNDGFQSRPYSVFRRAGSVHRSTGAAVDHDFPQKPTPIRDAGPDHLRRVPPYGFSRCTAESTHRFCRRPLFFYELIERSLARLPRPVDRRWVCGRQSQSQSHDKEGMAKSVPNAEIELKACGAKKLAAGW